MSLLQRATACLSKQAGQEALNAFISRTEHGTVTAAARAADERTKEGRPLSPIDGHVIGVKDNICTTESTTTCASSILRGFRSPYVATVVKKLQDAGAIIGGKTNLDEFGMGSHSTHSAFGKTINAIQSEQGELSAGGSSGGSAVAVASGQCWAALGTDTGGSVRLPASYCDIVGFKPSYGRLSRHGVVAYANSLDTVGILARNSQDARTVYEVLDGFDAKDPTSLQATSRARIEQLVQGRAGRSKLRIGVPMECNVQELDAGIRATWSAVLQTLAEQGHSVRAVSLPSTRLALAAYYILAPAEAASNLAKYDGVRYGSVAGSAAPEREEATEGAANVLYAATRGAGLGAEVRRRILLGSYSLSASAKDNYFLQAQRVRRMVCREFDGVFALRNALVDNEDEKDATTTKTSDEEDGVDVLLSPTAPALPPTLAAVMQRSPLDLYRGDVLTVPASLAGLPAISVPAPRRLQDWGQPTSIGLQLTAQFGDENMLFRAAAVLEALDANEAP